MYRAEDVSSGLYTYDDLPDQILMNYGSTQRTLNKTNVDEYGNPAIGYIYSDPTEYADIFFNEYFAVWSGSGFNLQCLISNYIDIVQVFYGNDTFANSYQIFAQGQSVIVTRTNNNRCIWTGQNEYGEAGIAYNGSSNNKWFAYISLPEPFFGTDGEKQGFQSSPVGAYYGGITVS